MSKKVLIIIPSIEYGGQEKVAVNTARMLSKEYSVTLFVFYRGNNEIDSSGINVISCGENQEDKFKIIHRLNKLNRLKKKFKYDVCLSFSPSANLINILTKKNEKILTSIRGYKSIFTKSSRLKLIQRRTDGIICVSKGIAEKVCSYYRINRKKVYVLYNSYDFDELERLSNESVNDYEFNQFTICNVSHMNEVKGIEHLLRAFTEVNKKDASIQLLLIGDGKLRDKLEEYSEILGVRENVTFMGYRENPHKYIKRSQLYVLTSENEGFPNSLVEAMIHIPVISADCETGPYEILTDGNIPHPEHNYTICPYGILVPNLSKSRNYTTNKLEKEELILANSILELKNNTSLYKHIMAEGRKRALEFNIKSYYRKLIEIIEKV